MANWPPLYTTTLSSVAQLPLAKKDPVPDSEDAETTVINNYYETNETTVIGQSSVVWQQRQVGEYSRFHPSNQSGIISDTYIEFWDDSSTPQWRIVIDGVLEYALGRTGMFIENMIANTAAGAGNVHVDTSGFFYLSTLDLHGSGSPEGAVTAPVGALYRRTDGGASTTLYVKESGAGNTGWVAK